MIPRVSLPKVALCGALLTAVLMTQSARAQLMLQYEENFGTHLAGDAYSGPFRINLQDFDNGAIYPSLGSPGTAAGDGANGTGPQTVSGGISTLNSLQAAGATGAQLVPTTINGVAQPASLGPDDSWGIARIVTITDLDGGVVWSEAATHQQLTVMFYGEKDFYVDQLANGFQEIDGTGVHADIYLQNMSDPNYTAYNPFLGSAGRTSASTYTTVTDGTEILSTVSTGGFIHPDGTLGGSSTEFSSIFNATSGGSGQSYLSVTGGTDASEFNTNSFTAPYEAGITADLFAQFTTVPTTTSDWLVRSNDPVAGVFLATPVPEPSTYGMAAVVVLAGVVMLRRRSGRQLLA